MQKPKETQTRWNKLAAGVRIAMGLVFAFSGLNHVFALVAMPPMTGGAATFWHGLQQAGYFFPLLGAVELGVGALLLMGKLVPLALTVAAPILVNVAAFHAVLARQGLAMAAALVAMAVFLARRHGPAFGALLAARAEPPAARVRWVELLLGLVFVASGVLGLLGRTPPPATPGAALIIKGFAAAGYFLPALCLVQIAAGALLVIRRYVGLALVALAPLVVEIVAYRVYVGGVTPKALVISLVLLAMEIALAVAYRRTFSPLLGRGAGAAGAARELAPARLAA